LWCFFVGEVQMATTGCGMVLFLLAAWAIGSVVAAVHEYPVGSFSVQWDDTGLQLKWVVLLFAMM
jgi:hypothetical protein